MVSCLGTVSDQSLRTLFSDEWDVYACTVVWSSVREKIFLWCRSPWISIRDQIGMPGKKREVQCFLVCRNDPQTESRRWYDQNINLISYFPIFEDHLTRRIWRHEGSNANIRFLAISLPSQSFELLNEKDPWQGQKHMPHDNLTYQRRHWTVVTQPVVLLSNQFFNIC